MRRVDIRAILADSTQRKEMCVRAILFMQAMEGIETTREQAEAAYDKIQKEKGEPNGSEELCHHWRSLHHV